MLKGFSLLKLEETVGAIGLAIMTTISFLNVITRYVFKYSMAFTEELTLYIFVWITLIGTAIAFREGANMAVTIIYNLCPKPAKKGLYCFSVICSIAFLTLMAYYGIVEVYDEILMNAMTEAMSLPVWWFTIAVPAGSIIAIVGTLQRAYLDLKSDNI